MKNILDTPSLHTIENLKVEIPYAEFKYEKERHTGRIKKIFRRLTVNGHLIPKFFFKDMGLAEYGYRTRIINYFMCKKVIVYDENIEKGMIMNHDKIKALKIFWSYIIFAFGFIFKYHKVREFYTVAFDEFKKMEFWEEKLEINEKRERN